MQAMLLLPDIISKDFLRVAVTDVFKRRFTSEVSLHIRSWEVEFPSLDRAAADAIEVSFSEEEIFNALKDANGEKAPDLDRFSFEFVRSFWHTLKGDLIPLFHSLHTTGEFDPRLSESFISLIPKVRSPSSLNDF